MVQCFLLTIGLTVFFNGKLISLALMAVLSNHILFHVIVNTLSVNMLQVINFLLFASLNARREDYISKMNDLTIRTAGKSIRYSHKDTKE